MYKENMHKDEGLGIKKMRLWIMKRARIKEIL